MSTAKDDEDFWNSSEKNFFCFENSDVNFQKESIFGATKSGITTNYLSSDESQWDSFKPLSAIVPAKTLKCILEADKEHTIYKESPIEKPEITVKKILVGQPYSLEQYKSLASKAALLDASIASGDGNATLGIILFLTKTLKKSLVQSMLKSRPEANHIYLHYLATRSHITEIVDILKTQGRSLDAAMKSVHIIIRNTSNIDKLLQKLTNCYKTLFVDLRDCKESSYLQSYIHLLEWQRTVKESDFTEPFVPNSSLLECLRHTCRDYWDAPEGHLFSPTTLCRQYQISPRQYQKVAISIRASVQKWDHVDNLLFTKNWVGAKKLQTNVSIEEILQILHEHQAPPTVLEKYLSHVNGIKKRLELAMAYKCHKTVIDILGNQGDKVALMEYKNQLKDGDYELYAENVLRNPTIKWKWS